MGKYNTIRKKEVVQRYKIHPIWTGVGFLMVLIVPVMTWAAAALIVEFGQQQRWAAFNAFPRFLDIPAGLYSIPGMVQLSRIPNLPIILILFFFLLVIFSGIFSVIYAYIYRLVGPPRYGPQDAPAPKIKTKPFKR
jgi:hypothetical protein